MLALNKQAEVEITLDAGHGRIEKRCCQVSDQLTFLDGRKEWFGLQGVAKIVCWRTDKRCGKQSEETRYYISFLPAVPSVIARAVRSYWAIENNLHWSLDVVLKKMLR